MKARLLKLMLVPILSMVLGGLVFASTNSDWPANGQQTDPGLAHETSAPNRVDAEAESTLELYGAPDHETIRLDWTVNTTLPVTATWHIDYYTQTASIYTATEPFSVTRSTVLTEHVENRQWYTVTLTATGTSPLLTNTVRVMPTDIFGYLPLVMREEAIPTTNQITQFGITWTFDQECQYGQFANGDYWVVGPVTITSITPASTVFTDGATRHGSMLNPSFPDSSDLEVVKAVQQGYDSRPGSYDPNLNVALGVSPSTPLVVPANNSLVSSVSYDTRPPGVLPYLKTAAVLTVLATPAPEGSFRPPFAGTDKTIRHNISDLDYAKLRRLDPPASAPSLAALEPLFQRPWIDTFSACTVLERAIAPYENMPDYGREFSIRVGDGALALNLNHSDAQKEKLLIYYVQVGLDLYGATTSTAGGRVAWWGGGGHRSGRKLPILFAGWMLDDSAMQTVEAAFAEDMQVYYYDDARLPEDVRGIPGWTGATALFKHAGTDDGVNPSWDGVYEHKAPADWTWDGRLCPGDPPAGRDSDRRGENYRTCCTGHSWVGMALAARLMDLVDVWNKPEFFDYEDRWMQEDMAPLVPVLDAGLSRCGSLSTTDPGIYGRSLAFHRDMWMLYRGFSDTVDPTVPTNVAAAALCSEKIAVTWTRARDNIGGLGYEVYRNGTEVGISYSNQFIDTGLSPQTTYTYTVRGVDSAGNRSAPSAPAWATTREADSQPPSVPGNLRATGVSPIQIVVRWDESTDNVGVDGYHLFRDGAMVLTTAQNWFFDDSRAPDSVHSYTVGAFDADENESGQAGPITATTQSVKPVVVPDGLQGYWRMDETDGEQVYDSSGKDRHGLVCDGAIRVVGKQAGAFGFDGIDDHVAVQGGGFDIPTTDQYSVAAWVWISETATTRQTIVARGDGAPISLFVETDGRLGARIRTSGPAATFYSTDPLEITHWHHVAATYQNGAFKLYVNGVEDVSEACTGAPSVFTIYLTIGSAVGSGYPAAGGQYFHGMIDDVRIYNRVLTSSEVATLFSYVEPDEGLE